MRSILFPITNKTLKIGIARLQIMFIDAKTVDDMKLILPYCNIILNHLAHRKEKRLSNEIFDHFWKRHEEIIDAKN